MATHGWSTSPSSSVRTDWNIRSVSIHPGDRWQICARPRFREPCIVLDRSVHDATLIGVEGQIGSARPAPESAAGRATDRSILTPSGGAGGRVPAGACQLSSIILMIAGEVLAGAAEVGEARVELLGIGAHRRVGVDALRRLHRQRADPSASARRRSRPHSRGRPGVSGPTPGTGQ